MGDADSGGCLLPGLQLHERDTGKMDSADETTATMASDDEPEASTRETKQEASWPGSRRKHIAGLGSHTLSVAGRCASPNRAPCTLAGPGCGASHPHQRDAPHERAPSNGFWCKVLADQTHPSALSPLTCVRTSGPVFPPDNHNCFAPNSAQCLCSMFAFRL